MAEYSPLETYVRAEATHMVVASLLTLYAKGEPDPGNAIRAVESACNTAIASFAFDPVLGADGETVKHGVLGEFDRIFNLAQAMLAALGSDQPPGPRHGV